MSHGWVVVGCLAVAAGAALAPPPAAAVESGWVDAWRADLAFLEEKLVEIHPGPFDRVSRSEIAAELDRLGDRLPALEHYQVVVELARVVARIGDGHTRVTLPLPPTAGFFVGHSKTPAPEIPGLVFGHLPVRFALFDDGLHVIRTTPDLAALAGSRVLSLGEMTAERAIAAVTPVVHRDNPGQLEFQLPDFLAIPEVLHATGVAERLDRIRLEVETAAGGRRSVEVAPLRGDAETSWVEAFDPALAPLYLQRREEPFWFEVVDRGRTVYFQFNEVADGPEETLEAFCRRLFAVVEADAVERLVVDLRWNHGGGNHLNRVLLHHLIRSRKLERPGALFVITGGGTFSAAMMLSVDLERHTNAFFVGGPTGSTPNHHGDSRRLRLPRTGITVRISTLHWQYSTPGDRRPAIRPHLPAAITGADYRAGRDPALAAILQPPAAPDRPAGRWSGRMTLSANDIDLALTLRRDANGWTGAVDLPRLELERAPVRRLQIDGEELRVRIPTPRFELELAGWFDDGRLYALATTPGAGRWYPVLLTLQP